MATGGTPQAGKVFSIPYQGGRGGVTTYAPNDPRLEREILGERRMAEDRAQERHDLSMQMELRRQAREDRALSQLDAIDMAQEKIDLALSNPASMKFGNDYEKIMGDPSVRKARTTAAGRQAIDSLLKERHDAYNDFVQGWEQTAQHYGWTGNVHDLPQLKDGSVDWDTTLKEHFNPALQQKHQKELQQQVAAREEAFRQRMVPSEITPTGEIKGYKIEKGQKPRKIKFETMPKEEQMAALSSLSTKIDPSLPKDKQKKLLMDLAKEAGYEF
jgi:hypothetical protein